MIIRFSALAGLALLSASPVIAQSSSAVRPWQTDVPCAAGPNPGLTVAEAPRETKMPGCVRAWCITAPDGRRACSCTRDTTIVVRVEAEGRVVSEWPADYSLAGTPESLAAVLVDLDGDVLRELVVAELQAVGNGLGIRHYRLSILDPNLPPGMPVRVNVQDYDPAGSFVRRAGGPCRLIATRWTELLHERRGRGMYFTGQWMRYRDGRLWHEPDRPVVVRRLLNGFRPWDVPGGPLAHFRDRRAQAWDRTPLLLPPFAGRRGNATIHYGDADTLRGELAPNVTFTYSAIGTPQPMDEGWLTAWLVDGATGRLYPPGYQAGEAGWLRRARAHIRTYAATDEGESVHLIVLEPEG